MDLKSSAHFKNQPPGLWIHFGEGQKTWGRRGEDRRFVPYQHRQGRNPQCSYDLLILASRKTLQARSVPLELRPTCSVNAVPGWGANAGCPASEATRDLLAIHVPLRVCLITAAISAHPLCQAWLTQSQREPCTAALPPHPPPGAEQDTTASVLLI